METMKNTIITVAVTINAPVDRVWSCFTEPQHIVRWNHASDDWHTPLAENDLNEGARFNYRMEAKDGSIGFNFTGTYNSIEPNHIIEYTLDDNRKVQLTFEEDNEATRVVETFEAEQSNSIELQREGWQSILNNFKKYAEKRTGSKKLHFEILINAHAEKVYHSMLDKQHYSKWTSAFNPASRYEGSWEKGSKIIFIGEDQDGKKGGMVSRIRENIPNEFVSIEHQGILEGEEEITSGPKVEQWAGGLENYSFTEQDGKTLVSVDMDSNEEYSAYFAETYPKALEILKSVCERDGNN